MPLHDGDSILNGRYTITRLIGEGGMASVWLAEDTVRRLDVAIKEPRAGLSGSQISDVLERFQRELRYSGALFKAEVPNVVRAITVEQWRKTPLLVMEYCGGGSLRERLLKSGPLPLDEALRITLDVLAALAVVHEKLMWVHRDIKPDNILFTEDGRTRLADFGLAQTGDSGRSMGGQPHPGTPQYMSPEQARTTGYLSPSSDLYSVAAVLFEMLTGKLYKRVRPGTAASSLRKETPVWLDDVLRKMLDDDQWQRYQSAEEMAAAVQAGQAADAEAQRVAKETTRREAAEKAAVEAEEKARREAEERARLEAAARAKAEADAKAQREADERARLATVAQAKAEAEEKERREAEERARQAAAARAKTEADEKARTERLERARQEAQRMAQEKEKARLAAEEAELERLYDEAIAAERAGSLQQAKDFLTQIVERRPGYERNGQSASLLLVDVSRRLAPAKPGWAGAMAGVTLLLALLFVASRVIGGEMPSPTATPTRVPPTSTATTRPMSPTTTRTPSSSNSSSLAPSVASDSVVLALQQEPDTLHPLVGSMMARTIVNSAIFPGCVGQNGKAEWIATGCETVPAIDNGGAKFVGAGADRHLEVTFKIKKGWRWTDGTPVTAKDAVYAWKLIMDPDFEIADRTAYEKTYDWVAVDDSTFVIKFLSNAQVTAAEAGTLTGNVPFAKFKDDYLGNGWSATGSPVVDPVYWNVATWLPSAVLSKVAAKDQASSAYAKLRMGDGAYVVKEWKPGQEIVLAASDKPFLLGTPKIKTITYRFFGETKAVIAALQKGEIDGVTSVAGLTPSDAPDLDKIAAAGAYKVEYNPEYSWEHIDINTTKFPLDDIKVRKALYYATDKRSIIDSLYNGKYVAAELPGAVLPTNSWAYTADYTKYTFDVAKAKALLTEAGWDCRYLPCTKQVNNVAKNLEITLMTTDRADRQKLGQVIQAQWKAANVGVNLQFLYGRGLFATCSAGGPLYCRTFDAAIYTWVGGDDPQFMGLYNCAGIPTKENDWVGQNNPGWCNKDADAALTQSETNADVTVSQAKRKPFLQTFFKAWTDEVPVIPLFVNSVPLAYRPGFKNYYCGPTQYAACGWNAYTWDLTR